MAWKEGLLLCVVCVWLAAASGVRGAGLPPEPSEPPLNLTKLENTTTPYEYLLDTCKGVVIRYAVNMASMKKIFPFSIHNATQPYKFRVDIDLVNAGYKELHLWQLFIGFQYNEVIAEAPSVSFVDGSTTPGALVGNGTYLIGLDTPDLLTSIATAQDYDLIAAKFNLTGTEFGVGPEQPVTIPFPQNLTLTNPGYSCNPPKVFENSTWLICCPENSTAQGVSTGTIYPPREKGDITMYYDVIQTMNKFYTAQVTINMDDPIGKLSHWNLTWDWQHGEFINTMKGAQTLEQMQDDCLNGPAGTLYTDLDFSTVMSCQATPNIVDLSPDRMADQQLIGCCRNGTLLPAIIDPSQTKSVFQLQVYKIKPNLAKDIVYPPYNWRIGDLMEGHSSYECGSPRLVSPSEFFTTGLHYNSAVQTWQVTCNQTKLPKTAPHKCCVSFSAFYNSSVIPCPTCSCGCQQSTMDPGNTTCNADPRAEAMLLPSYALLLPPSNRTILATALAAAEHFPQPKPVPCPDNCGLSINWHIYSDYTNGFSVRVTLFNWDPAPVLPWFAAADLGKALPGYEDVYSFNGSKITGYENDPNRTLIFMHGKDGYNGELLGLDQGLVAGKLQSLMSFDKRKTPGINVVAGDGFPKHVWFNGDECSLPDILPTSNTRRSFQAGRLILVVSLVAALLFPLAVL